MLGCGVVKYMLRTKIIYEIGTVLFDVPVNI